MRENEAILKRVRRTTTEKGDNDEQSGHDGHDDDGKGRKQR